MRIAALYYTDKPGGFCRRLYRLLNCFAEKGHEVRYFSLDQPPPALAPTVRWRRIPFPFAARRGLLFWALFTLWLPIYMLFAVRRSQIDRFVLFGAYYSAVTAPARAFWRIPCVLFLRSLVFKIDRLTKKPAMLRIFTELVERIGILRAEKIICMTESMRHEVERFIKKSLPSAAILPNDLPALPHTFQRVPSPKPVFLTAAVLDERKNISLLLRAAAKLEPGSFDLRIAGDGPLRSALEAEAQNLGLHCCRFLGWLPNLWPELSSCTLMIHPSLHEGISNSLLEAIAAGVPILASNIDEHREVLPNEILFDPFDAVGLAARLRAYIENPATNVAAAEDATIQAATRLRFDWAERALEMVCDDN